MANTLIRTGLGAVELVNFVLPAELDGAAVEVTLGSWHAPSTVWFGADDVTEVVQADGITTMRLLVGVGGDLNPAAGTYYRWFRGARGIEVLIRETRLDAGAVEIDTDTGQPLPLGATWATQQYVQDFVADHGGSGGPGGGATVVDNGNGTFTITP